MPFRSGALSVRRYLVTTDVPETLTRTATMALRRYAWRPIDADRAERESFGWVNPRNLLGQQLVWEDVTDGPLVFLAVRRDRKSFSKALFRAHLENKITDTLKEKRLQRLTRQHRIAIEEELTAKMLREVTPSIAFTELVWDRNTGEVFLAATGKSLCERIADLFTSTFDLKLEPQFPALLGSVWIAQQGLEEQFVVLAKTGGAA